jgi:hypothetical protein
MDPRVCHVKTRVAELINRAEELRKKCHEVRCRPLSETAEQVTQAHMLCRWAVEQLEPAQEFIGLAEKHGLVPTPGGNFFVSWEDNGRVPWQGANMDGAYVAIGRADSALERAETYLIRAKATQP